MKAHIKNRKTKTIQDFSAKARGVDGMKILGACIHDKGIYSDGRGQADDLTMSQLVELLNAVGPVKGFNKHLTDKQKQEGATDRSGEVAGFWTNFVLDGDCIRADFEANETWFNAVDASGICTAQNIFETISKNPKALGTSIRMGGMWVDIGSEFPAWRPQTITSVDFVEDPAACPNGMDFSNKEDVVEDDIIPTLAQLAAEAGAPSSGGGSGPKEGPKVPEMSKEEFTAILEGKADIATKTEEIAKSEPKTEKVIVSADTVKPVETSPSEAPNVVNNDMASLLKAVQLLSEQVQASNAMIKKSQEETEAVKAEFKKVLAEKATVVEAYENRLKDVENFANNTSKASNTASVGGAPLPIQFSKGTPIQLKKNSILEEWASKPTEEERKKFFKDNEKAITRAACVEQAQRKRK